MLNSIKFLLRFDRRWIPLLIVGMMVLRGLALASPYDEVENDVQSSPATVQQLNFSNQAEVLDFAIAPFGSEVFILLQDVDTQFKYELQDWPSPQQQAHTQWLIQQGVDLIIGHHPHVIQAPACVMGKPVFYSLGNHVFDQKYAITKQGLLADCRINAGKLSCQARLTQTTNGSSYPVLQAGGPAFDSTLANCSVPLSPGMTVSDYQLKPQGHNETETPAKIALEGVQLGKVVWKTPPVQLLSIASGRLVKGSPEEYVLTLERHYSPIDQELGVRPYVYQVTAHGLLARWRGSALAWPLLDARLLRQQDGVLCALHRGDNFLMRQPGTRNTRVMAYQWNGFGFSGLEDAQVLKQCQDYFK